MKATPSSLNSLRSFGRQAAISSSASWMASTPGTQAQPPRGVQRRCSGSVAMPLTVISGIEVQFVLITGQPQACASTIGIPNPSDCEAASSTSEAW